MNSLQRSLTANSIFSLLSGVTLLVMAEPMAGLFNLDSPMPFWIIGVGLVLFALSVYRQVKLQSPMGVLSIIVQDLVWVLGSIVLLIFNPFQISQTGNATIAVVAFIVLGLAMAQSQALAQSDAVPGSRIKRLSFQRDVNADAATTWAVIADVANYHQVAPNLDAVEILSGHGTGMVRSCSSGKDSWTETCTLWQEGEAYAFEVNTDAPDYPYPFSYLKGHWVIHSLSPNQTRIDLTFDFRYRRRIHNLLIHPMLKGKFRKTGEELLDNWQRMIENPEPVNAHNR